MTTVRERKNIKSKINKPSQKSSKRSEQEDEADSPAWVLNVLILLTVVIVIAVVIFLYCTSNSIKIIPLAHSKYINKELVYRVQCSDDYKTEPFKECVPTHCARVVMDGLVTEEEANSLLSLAKKGLAYGGSSGGASILDLHSGALSRGDKFINIYNVLLDQDNFVEDDFRLYKTVKDKIHQAIASHFGIPASKLYLTKPTFFSRMNTTEAKTVHDEYWHPHVDKVTYGSFHYTSLLYLTTYGEDFTGGRFVFVDKDRNKTVEPRLGRVSFFTSGSENLHFVEKLESGTRYAITISFTCDPKVAIADPGVRS